MRHLREILLEVKKGRRLPGPLYLAVACCLAGAEPPAAPPLPIKVGARPLSMKEAVRLAMGQNPQRLVAALVVSQRKQDQTIARSALLPQAGLAVGQGVKSFNLQSISGGPNPVRVGPFQTMDVGPSVSENLLNLPLLRQYQASREDVRTTTF